MEKSKIMKDLEELGFEKQYIELALQFSSDKEEIVEM